MIGSQSHWFLRHSVPNGIAVFAGDDAVAASAVAVHFRRAVGGGDDDAVDDVADDEMDVDVGGDVDGDAGDDDGAAAERPRATFSVSTIFNSFHFNVFIVQFIM